MKIEKQKKAEAIRKIKIGGVSPENKKKLLEKKKKDKAAAIIREKLRKGRPIRKIKIGLASPKTIKKWAERTLPNGKKVGQILSSQTVNYKTLKPEKGGLFCERIFGPINDFECACGKKKTKSQLKYCPKCDVEYTSSEVRRHRLGFIQLVSPVTHVWFLKGRPSYISILLDIPKKKIEALTYCTETLNTSVHLDSKQTLAPLALADTIIINQDLGNDTLNESSSVLLIKKKENLAPLLPLPLVDQSTFGVTKGYWEEEKQEFSSSIEDFTDYLAEEPLIKEKDDIPSPTLYSLSNQNSSWELNDDWTDFLYYMTSPIEKKDILIYKDLDTIFHFSNKKLNYSNQKLGAEAVRDLLSNLDFKSLERELRLQLFFIGKDITDLENEIKNLEKQGYIFSKKEYIKLKKFLYHQLKLLIYSRTRKLRRQKLVLQFIRTKLRPEWMILSILPVLPPELRPIIQLDGEQVAVSDLNKLYQKVLFRNNRVKRNSLIKSDEMKYAQRLLQEAVDALIENGKGGAEPLCSSNDRPLKSLSDILKGKKGRFRQNLLGKRVDYSGRSVIVVGPNLKLHECGLPKELAIELFQPFLIRNLMAKKMVRTIVGAKRIIQQQDSRIWTILEQVLQNHPILLNRAPTLHRVGFQAFQPKLVDGRAILLHPLVCTAFNADFDGDQMAVHIPLCFEARAEAWILMWSRNNLLSVATGQPLIIPSQDMVLGCYYLTTTNLQRKKKKRMHFYNIDEALTFFNSPLSLSSAAAYSKNIHSTKTVIGKKTRRINEIIYSPIHIHSSVWIRWNKKFETINEKEKPIEIQLQSIGSFLEIYSSYRRHYDYLINLKNQYIQTTIGRIIMNKNLHENLTNKKK
jgi:DNA-directed RNA polymerase subunit beta'